MKNNWLFSTMVFSMIAFDGMAQSAAKPETVTDADGNVYTTVSIGKQLWLEENLKTTKFSDSTSIPFVSDSATWAALTTPAFCNFNNTATTDTINMYGRLYNWYTVSTDKLCPLGWHVPTDAEWTTLITYLGGDKAAGKKLKETGTYHWISPNTGASNESKFTALPGGYREYSGAFLGIGLHAFWWSATELDADKAWGRYVYYYFGEMYREADRKQQGNSVRCLKD
jgi:uncharacterized protein (TIGR02145 family)